MSSPIMSVAEKTAYKRNMVKIRLARFGRKHQPIYNIVVMKAKKAQQKLPMEVIGTYNPIPVPSSGNDSGLKIKDVSLDLHRTKYWLGMGAVPTPRVTWLLKKVGLLPQFWPKTSALSQHIDKPVVEEIRETQELPVNYVRKRD